MADETRRQRRDARRASGEQSAPLQGRVVPQPAGVPAGESVTVPGARRRRFSFVHESIAELRKVEWPNRAQVVQGTIVVLVACVVVGVFLWVADLGLKPFVRDILLNS